MPLPALTWRRVATVNVAVAGNVNSILDAIYAAAAGSIYWTWGQDTTNPIQAATTAVYAQPVTPTALNQRIIWAGTTTAAGLAWQQYSSTVADARVPSQLYVGCARNGGAYTNWNINATPFTTGNFLGFAYAGSMATVDRVTLLESQEAVIVIMWRSAASTMSPSLAGAFIDPQSVSPQLAESDGRVYGIAALGNTTMAVSWLLSSAGNGWFLESGTSAGSRCGFFTPNAPGIVGVTRPVVYSPQTTTLSRANELVLIPLYVSNTGPSPTAFVGRLRQMYIIRDAINNQTWVDGAVNKGYIVGASTTGNADCVVVTA